MTRLFRNLLVLALVLVVASSALAEDKLFLWQIEGERATIHLTGSIHVGKPEFYPLPEGLEAAFTASPILAVEVDIADPAVMQAAAQITMTRGMLPGDATLKTSLEKKVWLDLVVYAEARDIDLTPYMKLRPSLVAMVLVLEEYRRHGFDENLGVDRHFLDAARAAGKEIRQLETIEAQMALFMDMSDTLDDLLILEVIEQADQIIEFTDKMIAAWNTGDAVALDDMLQSQMGDEPEMVEFYRKLLDNRNVDMVDKINQWLHGDEDVFVVVGAGHFGGEMGMISLLEQKGWAVHQIVR